MKTRIKYIKKNDFEGYYAIQVKIWIFWKTIYTDSIFANVEKVIDALGQINDFNGKVKHETLDNKRQNRTTNNK